MALIFSLSTGLGSMQRSSRIIGPLLRMVWPDISAEAIHDVQVAVRKGGHVTGYAMLAILLLRARNAGLFVSPWRWESAAFSEIVSTIYAVSDELHQSFVPSRWGSGWDVLLDSIGAAMGIGLIWVIGKLRGKW